MDKVQKQRGSIVLYKEERNGADYIRIEYVNSQAVALLLAQDTDVEKARIMRMKSGKFTGNILHFPDGVRMIKMLSFRCRCADAIRR